VMLFLSCQTFTTTSIAFEVCYAQSYSKSYYLWGRGQTFCYPHFHSHLNGMPLNLDHPLFSDLNFDYLSILLFKHHRFPCHHSRPGVDYFLQKHL
jgi:hypothetical protein